MLEEVVGSVLCMFELSFGGQYIQLDLFDFFQLVYVDGLLFEWVLINLLENVYKYVGVWVSIGICVEVDVWQLLLEVWDNGSGILVGQEQIIFDKFVCGNKELVISGVGLGFVICQVIVDVYGGIIFVSNWFEGGVLFCVILLGEMFFELEELFEEL